MSNTERTWTQDTPQADGVIFVGAAEFTSPTLANTGLSIIAEGNVPYVAPVSATTNFIKNIDQILRTGVLALGPIAGGGEEAFGTLGPPPVPGPSTVAGTSGPRAIKVVPPIAKTLLPTLQSGQISGPVAKGLQINSMDVVYTVLGAAATSVSAGLTQTKFGAAGAGAVAPVITSLITFGTNGLPVAIAANPVTTNVAVATPVMMIASPNAVIIHIQFVTPASCTVNFYGVNLHVSYNYN